MINRSTRRFLSAPLEYLSYEQMEDIHSASLEILEDVGVVVHHEEALELLDRAGAHIKDGKRVFIHSSLVQEAINTAPSRVKIYDRNGESAMFLEGRHVYYGTELPSEIQTEIDKILERIEAESGE